jgi:hypothetical protein
MILYKESLFSVNSEMNVLTILSQMRSLKRLKTVITRSEMNHDSQTSQFLGKLGIEDALNRLNCVTTIRIFQ